jgi:hypothetical protein
MLQSSIVVAAAAVVSCWEEIQSTDFDNLNLLDTNSKFHTIIHFNC